MSSDQRNPAATEAVGTEEWPFSSEPRSFKMDRSSPEASKLRVSVSNKLFEFLGTYSDEVLAEYIVVLVCNGKNQNQARADLEAFLGDESGKFVAWLWNNLSEETYNSKAPLDSSSLKTKVATGYNDIMQNEHKTSRLADHQIRSSVISDIPLSKDVKYGLSNFSYLSKNIEEPESLQRWCPSVNAALTEVDTDKTLKQTFANHMNTGAPDYNFSGVTKYSSSRVKCSLESSSGGEHHLQFENQVQKIAKSDSNAVTCQPFSIPKTEAVAKNLRSIIAEVPESRHLSVITAVKDRSHSAAMDAPHEITRPRGNVWDRLGKPCNRDDAVIRQIQHRHDLDVLEGEKLSHNGEGPQKLRSMRVVPDAMLNGETVAFDSCGRAISSNHSDEHRKPDNKFCNVGSVDHPDNSKRKRVFGEFNSGDCSVSSSGRRKNLIQYKEALPKLQGSLPVKNNHLQNLNEFTYEARYSTTLIPNPAIHPVKSSSTKPDLEADKLPQSQWKRRASVNTPMQKLVPSGRTQPSKSEHPTDAEGKNNNMPMQDEVLNVKSRLRQVEMDMLKLRSKQAEMGIDSKLNLSSGSQNHSEEDMESRTVLVKNVHFAASREALLSHFAKCGVVVKVVLLTDTVTAQPKGAAYVVFSSKESVNKALEMSGSSFLSRTLTVMRKSDMPPGFLVPAQLTGKPPQPWCPQPYLKGSVQRPYTSSHLQWRRDQPTGENSFSASTNGLGSSNTGD